MRGSNVGPRRQLTQHHLRSGVVLDPGLAGEGLEVDPVGSGERVPRRRDDDHLVVAEVRRAELRGREEVRAGASVTTAASSSRPTTIGPSSG